MATRAPGLKVFFPNTPIVIKPKGNFITSRGIVEFYVPVNQTKYEIRQYLKKIYDLDIIKVNTILHDGRLKRDAKGKWYKTPAYKKAIVTIDNTVLLEERAYQQIASPDSAKE